MCKEFLKNSSAKIPFKIIKSMREKLVLACRKKKKNLQTSSYNYTKNTGLCFYCKHVKVMHQMKSYTCILNLTRNGCVNKPVLITIKADHISTCHKAEVNNITEMHYC